MVTRQSLLAIGNRYGPTIRAAITIALIVNDFSSGPAAPHWRPLAPPTGNLAELPDDSVILGQEAALFHQFVHLFSTCGPRRVKLCALKIAVARRPSL
jgi:hypothetical protein